MANYITKEIGLDNMTLPPHGVTILYSIWTIKDKKTGAVIFHDDHDTVNITSRIFTNIFELGKTYIISLSMVRTDGPTIATEPFEVTISATGDITDKYHIPSVVDTPVITTTHAVNNVPNANAVFTSSEFMCFGNAVHKATNWWLMADDNKLIWESIDDETNLTSIRLDMINLNPNRTYTLFCVYKGTNRDTSAAGSITFTVNDFPELKLKTGLEEIRYGLKADLALDKKPNKLTAFNWEVWGEDKMLLASGSNKTGVISIPVAVNGKTVLNKEDGFVYYNLRVKATVNGAVIGWKDHIFNPLELKQDSIAWNKNIHYVGRPEIVTMDIASFGNVKKYEPITGITHQLPDGRVLMPRGNYTFGLYDVGNNGISFTYVGSATIPSIKKTNVDPGFHNMLFRPLDNGKILFCPDTANLNAYLYIIEYDLINKKFNTLKEINLGKTDTELGYTEYHYLSNNRVLLCTVKDNVPTIGNNFSLRVLDTESGSLTLLKDKTHATASLYSSLIRTGANTFIVMGSTKADIKVNDGRALTLTVNPDDSFTVSALTTTLFNSLSKNLSEYLPKRLRAIQMQNGQTLVFAPDYYDASTGILEGIKYNILDGGDLDRKGEITVPNALIRVADQALGFVIKLNDGTIIILNGRNLFALKFDTEVLED